MQDEIILAGKVFKRDEENLGHYRLQGQYEGAFFLSFDEKKKTLDVAMNMGCPCCSPGSRNLEQWETDLCEGRSCYSSDGLCKYAEEGECEEGTSPLDLEWNKMAEDAKKQFPDWEVNQTT